MALLGLFLRGYVALVWLFMVAFLVLMTAPLLVWSWATRRPPRTATRPLLPPRRAGIRPAPVRTLVVRISAN